MTRNKTAFLFDLDGTLVDSVYPLTAAARLGVDIRDSLVLGDSIWDMIAAQRARALGVGLLSGGYGEEELARAGAFRVYADPADLLDHIDEIAARS